VRKLSFSILVGLGICTLSANQDVRSLEAKGVSFASRPSASESRPSGAGANAFGICPTQAAFGDRC